MSVIYNGLYSIDFVIDGVTYNTWKTFGLIPKRKPIIMPPEPTISINNSIPNKYYLDESGSMIYKEYLDSSHRVSWDYDADVQFRHRTGEWEFITNNDIWAPNNDTKKWIEYFRSLVNTLHGKKLSIKLNNYDDIYYDGYVEITNYSSEDLYSTVTLTYYILENAEHYDRFYNDFIPEFPEQESSEHGNSSDKIDYSTGPTTDFVIDNGGGLDINYDEVPPELSDDPDNPENPDEPTEHYANAVQYATDPEPYTADGWTLVKSGYFELNNTIQINDDYYTYKNDSDAIPLKSIAQTGYGIEYRIHIYTNNPINYNVILYNDYDNSLNDKCYESGVMLNSKKYDDCYKMYTNDIKTYINNPWIYIIPSIKQDIGVEILPNSFSYFIYINTNSTAVAVPGQDKFSINFNANPESSLVYHDGYELVKNIHGFPLLTKVTSTNAFNGNNYMSIRDSAFKLDWNGINDDITIELIIIHNSTSTPKLALKYPITYHGDDFQYDISESHHFYTVQRDFYTIDEYTWTGGTDEVILPLFEYNTDDKKYEYTYFLYIDTNLTQLVEYNNTDFKWYDNTYYMFFSDIKAVPNTRYPNYIDYQLIKHGYDAPDVQRHTSNGQIIYYAISNSVFKLKSKNEDGTIKFYVRIYTSNSNLNSSDNERYVVTTYKYAFPTSNYRHNYEFIIDTQQEDDYSYRYCSKTITIDTQDHPIWYFDIQTRVKITRNIEDIAPSSYFIYIDPTTTEVVEN